MDDLWFCKTCDKDITGELTHDSSHNIIPLEWVIFCGECGKTIEREWSYCPYCGEHFTDW